jgi:hypothetical protein
MPSTANNDNTPAEVFHFAVVDLDLSASQTLRRLGWLDVEPPATEMDVNEACTWLLRCALIEGLSAPPKKS